MEATRKVVGWNPQPAAITKRKNKDSTLLTTTTKVSRTTIYWYKHLERASAQQLENLAFPITANQFRLIDFVGPGPDWFLHQKFFKLVDIVRIDMSPSRSAYAQWIKHRIGPLLCSSGKSTHPSLRRKERQITNKVLGRGVAINQITKWIFTKLGVLLSGSTD